MRSAILFGITLVLSLGCSTNPCSRDSDCDTVKRCFHGYCVALQNSSSTDTRQQMDGEWSNTVCSQKPAPGELVVNEVLAAPPPDADVNGDGIPSTRDDEFVELVNVGPVALQLNGVQLLIGDRVKHRFAPFCLDSGAAILLFSGGKPALYIPRTTVLVSEKNIAISNDGGVIRLVLGAGELDRFSYPSLPVGHSATRFPDRSGDIIDHQRVAVARGLTFSPGTCADGTPFPSCTTSQLQLPFEPTADVLLPTDFREF